VLVRDFQVTYRPTGQPEDFVTRATISQADRSDSRDVEIRVNEPAEFDGVRYYQFGYGWAPVVEARSDGELVASQPIVCTQDPPPEGVSPLQLPWNCVLKIPSLDPQVGVTFELWPDSRGLVALLQTGTAMPMFGEYAPVMTYTVYEGDLRSELVQQAGVLDTTAMREVNTGVIGAGETVSIAGGVTMTFGDLRRYTVLEVARDRGMWIVFAAAILVLAGLLPALYTSRRKLWVTAEPDGGGTVLKVGGFALQRRQQFEEEFSKLVSRLERASREGERVDA
jgi:cytochrome c biogenesis protein ResB